MHNSSGDALAGVREARGFSDSESDFPSPVQTQQKDLPEAEDNNDQSDPHKITAEALVKKLAGLKEVTISGVTYKLDWDRVANESQQSSLKRPAVTGKDFRGDLAIQEEVLSESLKKSRTNPSKARKFAEDLAEQNSLNTDSSTGGKGKSEQKMPRDSAAVQEPISNNIQRTSTQPKIMIEEAESPDQEPKSHYLQVVTKKIQSVLKKPISPVDKFQSLPYQEYNRRNSLQPPDQMTNNHLTVSFKPADSNEDLYSARSESGESAFKVMDSSFCTQDSHALSPENQEHQEAAINNVFSFLKNHARPEAFCNHAEQFAVQRQVSGKLEEEVVDETNVFKKMFGLKADQLLSPLTKDRKSEAIDTDGMLKVWLENNKSRKNEAHKIRHMIMKIEQQMLNCENNKNPGSSYLDLKRMQEQLIIVMQQSLHMDAALEQSLFTTQVLVQTYNEQLQRFDKNKLDYNFMFMYASPNYMLYKTSITEEKVPYARLQNVEEYRRLKETVDAAGIAINVLKVHGTIDNFTQNLERNKIGGIHFSGHGVEDIDIKKEMERLNPKMCFGEAKIKEVYEKGSALVMENDNLLATYLHATELKQLLRQYNAKPDFVFIASCHSEFAAEIFNDAGSQHTISVKQDEKILDEAILTFTKSFYNRIWETGSKVCVCFKRAQIDVKLKHGAEMAEKFIIKRNPWHTTKNCPLMGNFQKGKATYQGQKPLLEDVPPSVNLTGMVDNVQLLIDNFFMRGSGNKLCSVTGLAGMGKSALARYAVSLIQERVLLDGGCIYVNCRGIREIDVLFEKTMKAIRQDKSGTYKMAMSNDDNEMNMDQNVDFQNSDKVLLQLKLILEAMKDKDTERRFVFFFDNVEDLINEGNSKQKDKFVVFLNEIMFPGGQDDAIKVLITCREPLNTPTVLIDYNIELTGLHGDNQVAWNLFKQFYKEQNTNNTKELQEFMKFTPQAMQFNAKGKRVSAKALTKNNIGNHHLFDLLGRHPQAIILAAQLHRSDPDMSLVDLYMTLSQASGERCKVKGDLANALDVTLSVKLKTLKEGQVQFLQLLSLLPQQNYISDLEKYWQWFDSSEPVKSLVDQLKVKLLIKVGEATSKEFQGEKFIWMNSTIAQHFKEEMQTRPEQLYVRLMLLKNYTNKMRQFYLTYKNSLIQESSSYFHKEDLDKAEFMLKSNEDNLFSAARCCLFDWMDDKKAENQEKQTNVNKKNWFIKTKVQSLAEQELEQTMSQETPGVEMTSLQKLMREALHTKLEMEIDNGFKLELLNQEQQAEQFIMFLCYNMFLIERYDFIKTLLKRVKLDVKKPNIINSLPVSHYFLGNLWRIEALSLLYTAKKKSSMISEGELEEIVDTLHLAVSEYKKSKCPNTGKGSKWGLGLTYNLLGRMYCYKSILDIKKAKSFYQQAAEAFQEIDHYRGLYNTFKDLYELEHKMQVDQQFSPWTQEMQKKFDAKKSDMQLLQDQMNTNFRSFIKMQRIIEQQTLKDQEPDEVLFYMICCADRTELSADTRISLDLELVLTEVNESIGAKLMKNHYQEQKFMQFQSNFGKALQAKIEKVRYTTANSSKGSCFDSMFENSQVTGTSMSRAVNSWVIKHLKDNQKEKDNKESQAEIITSPESPKTESTPMMNILKKYFDKHILQQKEQKTENVKQIFHTQYKIKQRLSKYFQRQVEHYQIELQKEKSLKSNNTQETVINIPNIEIVPVEKRPVLINMDSDQKKSLFDKSETDSPSLDRLDMSGGHLSVNIMNAHSKAFPQNPDINYETMQPIKQEINLRIDDKKKSFTMKPKKQGLGDSQKVAQKRPETPTGKIKLTMAIVKQTSARTPSKVKVAYDLSLQSPVSISRGILTAKKKTGPILKKNTPVMSLIANTPISMRKQLYIRNSTPVSQDRKMPLPNDPRNNYDSPIKNLNFTQKVSTKPKPVMAKASATKRQSSTTGRPASVRGHSKKKTLLQK